MSDAPWLTGCSPAFRLMLATSWLAPDSWRDLQERAIREALEAGVDWSEFLRLMDRHRTPALSWAALKSVSGWDAPELVRQELQRRSDACRVRAAGQALLLAEVLKGFNSAGIAVMPIKGPLLSLELYGDIGMRHANDLDIMVAQHELRPALACLEKIGWRSDASRFPIGPRQWQALLRREHHIGLNRSQRTYALELHWRNPWDDADQSARRWARTATTSWRGHSFEAMSPVDLALYLCSHGSNHTWFRAKWLGDLARIHTSGLVDWEAALQEARQTNQELPLWLGMRLLNDAYGLPVPALRTKSLPPFLINRVVADLKTAAEPEPMLPLRRLQKGFRKFRYDRLLWPHISWKQSFADLMYGRKDFQVLQLPDGLFWLYAPLRPFLWAWRRLLRGGAIFRSGK